MNDTNNENLYTYQDMIALNKELSDLKFALDESSIIAITDHKGIIQVVNKKFCELSKYNKEELIGRDHRILNSRFHSKEFFREMWKTIGSGKVWRGEIQNKAKDGSLYWVQTTIVPILNEKGKPYRYVSIRTDITDRKQMEAALRKSLNDDFLQTVNNLDNGIFKMKKDLDGKIYYTMAEGKLLKNLGLTTENHKFKTPYEIFPKEIAALKHKHYQKAFQGHRINYELELGGRWLFIDVTPVIHAGKVVEIVGSVHDVTELKATQKQLQENQFLFQSLFSHSQDAVCIFNKKGEITNMNPAAENMLMSSLDKMRGISSITFIENSIQDEGIKYFRKALQGEIQNFDTAIHVGNKDIKHLNLTFLPIIVDQQTVGIYSIGKDITDQKNAQELNAFLARHDELTKLLNRRGFEEKLNWAISNAHQNNQKFAVLYVDLDRFKNVNDTLGHLVGDRLLEQIALRFNHYLEEKTFIARMGGDEFMVLVPLIEQEEDTTAIAEEIIKSMNEPFFIDDNELFVTASIGISLYPEHGGNMVDLIKNSDIALYKAKDQGRNNYHIFSNNVDQVSMRSFLLERDLRKALLNNEFTFHLQPRVHSRTRKMVSAEALIRWNHPTLGIVSPAEFIPLAEETGLIILIGKWMKRAVCEQMVKWREQGVPLVPISINISAQRFIQRDFAVSVKAILEEFSLDGSLLEFEITENSLMRNEEDVIQTLHNLKQLGIKIYIDDFGTGYSSFSYLKSFKLDGIKIDQSFIRNISCQSENAGITAAMIQLAKILNLEVIAEGVETREELLFLHEHDCDQVQGYLFAKPSPIEIFEKWLINGL